MGHETLDGICESPGKECGTCQVALNRIKAVTAGYLERNGAHLGDFALITKGDRKGVASIWFGNPIAKIEGCELTVIDDNNLSGPEEELL